MTTLSLLQVQARWAYSEIADGTLSYIYDNGPNVEALRAKCTSGIPIDELSQDELYNLAFLCVMTRPNLMIFVTGVERLAKLPFSKTQIATFLVPQMVSGSPGFMSFEEFLSTPACSPKDACNVVPAPEGHRAPSAALTAGAFFESPVLLDGYHRAASFWKFANRDAVIDVYLPRRFVSEAY